MDKGAFEHEMSRTKTFQRGSKMGLPMRYVRVSLVVFAGILCMAASCPPRVYTPPTRIWSNETSPMPLAKGSKALSVTGGWGVRGGLSCWNGSGGALTYRGGLGDSMEDVLKMEGELNLSYLRIDRDVYKLNIEPQAFSLRAALKVSPPGISRFVSARAGMGLGTTGAGQYAGFDFGFVLGWYNSLVVPFVNVGWYVSFPFYAIRMLFLTEDPNSSLVSTDSLETTYGMDVGAGLKFYILSKERPEPDKISLALFIMMKSTLLRAENHDDEWPVAGVSGIEVEF